MQSCPLVVLCRHDPLIHYCSCLAERTIGRALPAEIELIIMEFLNSGPRFVEDDDKDHDEDDDDDMETDGDDEDDEDDEGEEVEVPAV